MLIRIANIQLLIIYISSDNLNIINFDKCTLLNKEIYLWLKT
jgi:hypothetical protein